MCQETDLLMHAGDARCTFMRDHVVTMVTCVHTHQEVEM